jgi:hypothetical protein
VVLPPVGGITVYETFELSLHPVRLQIDSRVGRRIMEYLWPARKDRYDDTEDDETETTSPDEVDDRAHPVSPTRTSLDSPRALQSLERQGQSSLSPPIRRLASSRSFTDLRSPKSTTNTQPMVVLANHSVESLTIQRTNRRPKSKSITKNDAAAEMRTRSGQKTFILVKILRFAALFSAICRKLTQGSLDVLLSVLKEGSFECHDAHIKTRQLEYHNKTWSVRFSLCFQGFQFTHLAVRRIGESIHSVKYDLEGMGKNGIATATLARLPCGSGAFHENKILKEWITCRRCKGR